MDDYDQWIKEVCDIIYPTWHGYTFDLDGVDSKATPYYKKGVPARAAASALLYEHAQLVEAFDSVRDKNTTIQ